MRSMCSGSHRTQHSGGSSQEGHREQNIGNCFTAEEDMIKVGKIMNQVNTELLLTKFCTTSGWRSSLKPVGDECKTGERNYSFS